MEEIIRFIVFRFDPTKDKEPYFKTYKVPYRKGLTVLDGLIYIFENYDPTLSARINCRQGICGSDGMLINGKYELACKTQIKDIAKNGIIKLEPMPNYPIIKDLIVDLSLLYKKTKKARAYFIREIANVEREYIQKQEQVEKIEPFLDCVLCGACLSACPVNETNFQFLGPAPLMRAYKFAADSRDRGNHIRFPAITDIDGIYRCHLAYSCVEACPRELAPAIAIRNLKRMAFRAALTGRVKR